MLLGEVSRPSKTKKDNRQLLDVMQLAFLPWIGPLLSILSILLLLLPRLATALPSVQISAHRSEYDRSLSALNLDQQRLDDDPSYCPFGRFQSPDSINDMLQSIRRPFRYYRGKDGRAGRVSCTKILGNNDWVLAESRQVAVNCTTRDVLETYLQERLQAKWNRDKVMDCNILACRDPRTSEWYYRQDLVLRSQRVIRSQTGVMHYSQRLVIDQIGKNDYCVGIALDTFSPSRNSKLKPFEKLHVYVHLRQQVSDVHIYAAGIMKVNRRVVPHLVVFDASGIAGSMAGKGTLWLAAYFDERQRLQSQQSGTVSKQQQRPKTRLRNSFGIGFSWIPFW